MVFAFCVSGLSKDDPVFFNTNDLNFMKRYHLTPEFIDLWAKAFVQAKQEAKQPKDKKLRKRRKVFGN